MGFDSLIHKRGMTMSSTQETFTISVTFLGETDKAIRVSDCNGTYWLPKSLITEVEGEELPGMPIEVEMPVWFLEKEGLV